MDVTTEGIVAALISTVGGYILKGHNARLKKIEDSQAETGKDLAAHKLDSEKRYAKEETMYAALVRLHDKIETGFSEIRDDIKQIMVAK